MASRRSTLGSVATLLYLASQTLALPECVQISTPSYRPTYNNAVPDDAGLWSIDGLTYTEAGDDDAPTASLEAKIRLDVADLNITCTGHGSSLAFLMQYQGWSTARMDEREMKCTAAGREDFQGILTPVWYPNGLSIKLEASWGCEGVPSYNRDIMQNSGNQTGVLEGMYPFNCDRQSLMANGKHCEEEPKVALSSIKLETSIGFQPIILAPIHDCASSSTDGTTFEVLNLTALTPEEPLASWQTRDTLDAISVVFGSSANDGLWRCDLSSLGGVAPSSDVMLSEARRQGGSVWYRCHVFSRGESAGIETWVAFDPVSKVLGIDQKWACEAPPDSEKSIISYHAVGRKVLDIECASNDVVTGCGPLTTEELMTARLTEPAGEVRNSLGSF